MKVSYIYLSIFLSIYEVYVSKSLEVDPNGYVAYCPCMGRFGNQADHFLGSLNFAKALNRTLIVPPWVEYRTGQLKSVQVSFSKYFNVNQLSKFSRVILMEIFMKEIAHIVWKPDRRISFCYRARHGSHDCSAKDGNPFGPFWDTFNIDFVSSEFYGPLNYDVHREEVLLEWKKKYPHDKWPVLAFTGAPASFPVQKENLNLHKFLIWNDNILKSVKAEVQRFPRGPFIGIHLRNGVDWVRACSHVNESPLIFAAPQCLGYKGEEGAATHDLCLPSDKTIERLVKRIVRMIGAKSVFVASDSDHRIPFLTEVLLDMKIPVHKLPKNNPHVELAILARANHFIGNCISSFSAFVKRERDSKGLQSSFWGMPVRKAKSRSHKEEL